MNILRGLGNYVLGSKNDDEIALIAAGQLFLVRPHSSRGHSEQIYKDAAASIRKTVLPHQYELVITKAFEEGEDQELDSEVERLDAIEKPFLLDDCLELCMTEQAENIVFAWRDLSGDRGDMYEFACDTNTGIATAKNFQKLAAECQFERKYGRSSQGADQLLVNDFVRNKISVPASRRSAKVKTEQPHLKQDTDVNAINEKAAKLNIASHSEGETLSNTQAELHLFDSSTGVFVLQDSTVTASIVDIGSFNCRQSSVILLIQDLLSIRSATKQWITLSIEPLMNPVFSFEQLSFIFNFWVEEREVAFSWLLRFESFAAMESIQMVLMQALWEHLNQQSWRKVSQEQREYVMSAFSDGDDMLSEKDDSVTESPGVGDQDSEEESEDDDDSFANEPSAQTIDKAQVDENSQLAVGYKHDRSFVVRGNKIGVFKHTNDDKLVFSTTIDHIKSPSSQKLFSPSKVMLHEEDKSLVLQNPADRHKLYRMDLEYGKVVDEWQVHDDIETDVFMPGSKFAPMTGEQTLLGVSHNALYRVDPRLSGSKLVDSEFKQYASKNDFSAAATTEQGYVAIASNKGDIRLFDRIGINAKTQIPQLGEPIVGLDVSADGRWILATCNTYLLLVDATITEGKNEGRLGFEKGFGKDSKPRPRRLQLR